MNPLAVLVSLALATIWLPSLIHAWDKDCQNCYWYGSCDFAYNFAPGQYCGTYYDSQYNTRYCCCSQNATCAVGYSFCDCIEQWTPEPTEWHTPAPTPSETAEITASGSRSSSGAGAALGIIVPLVIIVVISVIYKKRQSLKVWPSPLTLSVPAFRGYGRARVPILEAGVLKYIDPFQNDENTNSVTPVPGRSLAQTTLNPAITNAPGSYGYQGTQAYSAATIAVSNN